MAKLADNEWALSWSPDKGYQLYVPNGVEDEMPPGAALIAALLLRTQDNTWVQEQLQFLENKLKGNSDG